MTGEPIEYELESLAQAHEIDAALFVPFIIQRLGGDAELLEVNLTVTLRDIAGSAELRKALRLKWTRESIPVRSLGVPEQTLTEWAALGVACVAVMVYAGLTVRAVTGQGDRFDYWVSDGKDDYGLEVSGTLAPDLETRHRAKERQLRENPFGVDGYVVVVGFATREVLFSFHRIKEIAE